MSDVTIYPGDNRDSLRLLAEAGVQVDGVVTDPPYHLTSIVKRYGGETAKRAQKGRDGLFSRVSENFMHKTWDACEIERDPEFWKLVLDVMKPGAFCLAFSGASTSHWQGVAMEMAGFTMHPMIAWVYASGLPKGHCAALAIDKLMGATVVEFDGQRLPMTPEAEQWAGWRYGSQTLKPAFEPIFMAQKPIDQKSVARNLLVHGVGGINVDSLRIPVDAGEGSRKRDGATRFPPNVMLQDAQVVKEMFPSDKAGRSAHRFYSMFGGVDTVDVPPVFYHPKAGREDRGDSKHPTVKPVGLLEKLISMIVPPEGVVLDPFAGSGTTAIAAGRQNKRAMLMESDDDYITYLGERFSVRLSPRQNERTNAASVLNELL